MNLSAFLSIIRARLWAVLFIFALTAITTIGVSVILPKQYTATATVVVDQTRPDPVTGERYTGNPAPAFMATQADVLKSERVARRVIRDLKLAENPDVRAAWMRINEGAENIETWLVQGLQSDLEVKPSRESNVISVSYVSGDPKESADMANAVVQAYLDVLLDMRVDPAKQTSGFFDTRAKELRANVEHAQAKLSAYQRENGVFVATDGQFDVETARLGELSQQLVALQGLATESGSRQKQAQVGAADKLQEVVNNPELSILRTDIARAEARLQELTSRFGDNHPQVIEVRANIASLHSRLSAQTARVTGSLGVANTINRQREAEVRAALEVQRAKVLRMRTAREEGAVLVRDVQAAQRAYEAVVSRLDQTKLESRSQQSSANVLALATPPILPSSPKIGRNALISIVLGLALGIGAAMLLEFVDRRLHTVDEVSELLGLPLLGVLPRPGGKGRFIGRRTPLVSPRGLYRQLPAPGNEAL